MSAFRNLPARAQIRADRSSSADFDDVRLLISDALLPAHFYLKRPGALEWQPRCHEEISWEIYGGRLLDSAHTRQHQKFEAWNIFWIDAAERSEEPILSVKLDVAGKQVHVVRAIHCYAWEGYHAGDNVYLSRETRKWVRELVGTIHLDEFSTGAAVRDELICLLFQAVVGCSRLALTSVEAPLPGFALGELAYVYRSGGLAEQARTTPMHTVEDLIQLGLAADLNWIEKTKLLEIILRTMSDDDRQKTGELFIRRWYTLQHDEADFFALCRNLFNAVSLTPYTEFAPRAVSFIGKLVQSDGWIERHVDFLSHLLRQIARHLTAYDLITFHHKGANYPDASLLDLLSFVFSQTIADRDGIVMPRADDPPAVEKQKRLRRRAVRSAWLTQKLNENLPVPDAPTSPGENSRVLPAPYHRVSEEQILQPALRTKRLFEWGTTLPAPASLLPLIGNDLDNADELLELGMALFADRPLGIFKPVGEPDRTLILSYEAWSRSIAMHRLELLYQEELFFGREKDPPRFREMLKRLNVFGVPVQPSGSDQRPAALSLADAAKVANDFLLLRTTRQTVWEFLELLDFTQLQKQFDLAYLDPQKRVLIVSGAAVGEGTEGVLLVYDDQLRRRLELQVDSTHGYQVRAGREYPAAGLKVVRLWELAARTDRLQEYDLRRRSLTVLVRA